MTQDLLKFKSTFSLLNLKSLVDTSRIPMKSLISLNLILPRACQKCLPFAHVREHVLPLIAHS